MFAILSASAMYLFRKGMVMPPSRGLLSAVWAMRSRIEPDPIGVFTAPGWMLSTRMSCCPVSAAKARAIPTRACLLVV